MAAGQAIEDEYRESGQPIDSGLADALRKSRQSAIMTLVENGVIDISTLEERQKYLELKRTVNPAHQWDRFSLHTSPRDVLRRISGFLKPK